jgi:hypothetical protein
MGGSESKNNNEKVELHSILEKKPSIVLTRREVINSCYKDTTIEEVRTFL